MADTPSSPTESFIGLETRLIVHDMHNVKIISLKTPFTHEFNGVLCVSCMSYIIALIFGWSNLASKNALGPI